MFGTPVSKNLNIFCKRQISIKLSYLYQRYEYRDNYFFKIEFVFFLYLLLSVDGMEMIRNNRIIYSVKTVKKKMEVNLK
jgi:hypothetical protein